MINNIKIEIKKVITYICKIFPIKKNKIILWSNDYKDYGCNPKYIVEYLLNNFERDKFDIIWAINKDSQSIGQIPDNVKIVEFGSINYLYNLMTSKIIITNHRIHKDRFFYKRRGQFYIQTWHSSIRLKKIEKDIENNLSEEYIQSAKLDANKCDLIISGCKFSTSIYKNSFWYNGDVFECGTPRSDILLNNNESINKKVKKYFGIQENKKIVMYAPTFRNNHSIQYYNINLKELISSIQNKFSGEWIVLFRLHPHIAYKSKEIYKDNFIYDASQYSDMQELLTASDILITDYSSSMFDFCLAKKPCFLYASDLNDYLRSERQFYFDINKLPFSMSETNETLNKNIQEFNKSKYIESCEVFLKQIGSIEDGSACKRICEYINKKCYD